MKKHLTKKNNDKICMRHEGKVYQFPKKVAEKYCVPTDPDVIFKGINDKYSKPGALLRGLRLREGLTQIELAKLLKVTQSDVSQMENGLRHIGRTLAKRIEKKFDVDYHLFLE